MAIVVRRKKTLTVRQAYNLWSHNCNNFSNDFATFLTGKGIPDHILHMPQAVINSPLGAMLIPALNQSVNANRQNGGILGIESHSQGSSVKPAAQQHHHEGKVRNVTSVGEFDSLLASAHKSCAVVFFTSANCPPCKLVYPLYDELAADAGNKAVLIKVDTIQVPEIASRYSIRATPTFVTFLKGKEENRWLGLDPAILRGNVQLLFQMANPRHLHQALNLPTFSKSGVKPVLFTKIPPLPKLVAKMGDAANNTAVKEITAFIETREKKGAAAAPLPDMATFTAFVKDSARSLPQEVMFTVVDLLRCGLIDPRFSGYMAEEAEHATILALLGYVNSLSDCPYALRLVTLQMACNLFSSRLYTDQILGNDSLRPPIIQLLSTSFLDDSHNNVRVAAASLLFNVALANGANRKEQDGPVLPEGDEVELAAATLEAISQEEESPEALEGMLSALGHLVYLLPVDGELADLLRTMDAEDTVLAKKKHFRDMALISEVGSELLGKGLRKP